MATGVRQRHSHTCPRKARCRCAWAYHLEWRTAGGQRHQEDKGGYRTQRDALAARAEALNAKRAGVTASKGMTVGKLLDADLHRREAAGVLRPTTLRAYRMATRLYLKPYLGAVKLSDLRAEHVDTAFADIRRDHPQLGPASLKLIHRTLSSTLQGAVKRRQLLDNAARWVELPSARKADLNVWTPQQFGAFIDDPAVRAHYLGAAFEVMGFTGLRRGEVAALRWSDLDLDAGVLTLRQAAAVTGYHVHIGAPKTRAGERTVYLHDGLIERLREHRVGQLRDKLAAGAAWVESGYVFTMADGQMVHPSQYTRTFLVLSRKLGMPRIRLHDLRHLAASLQISAGVPIEIVSKGLGHGHVGITSGVYSHLLTEAGQRAAAATAAYVPRASTTA